MKIQTVQDGDLNNLDEFEGEFVGEIKGRFVFETPWGPRTYPTENTAWASVDRFSYET